MILKNVEKLVGESKDSNFTYPIYNGYSLVNLPNTIMEMFGIKPVGRVLDRSITDKINKRGIRKVAVILIDGFGYDMFLKSCKYSEFFKKFVENGIVAPITSGFPSTTAASITTMNTGLTPQEHGLLEWLLYFKEIDKTINTLPFTSMEDKPLTKKYNPKILYQGDTIFKRFGSDKVPIYTIANKQIANSDYNLLFKSGNTYITHFKNSDLAIRLRVALEKEKRRSYFYSYISSVDSSIHALGPSTEESEAEILSVSHALEDGLIKKIDKKTAAETLVIITADHGHTLLNPKDTIYLNKYRKLNDYYERGKNGKIIPPTGSPRDVFLHIKSGKLEEAEELLNDKLSKVAKVMKIKDAIESGLFGYGKLNKNFANRAGNLLILPHKNKSIWYEHIKGEKFDKIGMHGGLSKEEMLIPLAAARLSDLIK